MTLVGYRFFLLGLCFFVLARLVAKAESATVSGTPPYVLATTPPSTKARFRQCLHWSRSRP